MLFEDETIQKPYYLNNVHNPLNKITLLAFLILSDLLIHEIFNEFVRYKQCIEALKRDTIKLIRLRGWICYEG